MVEEFLQMTLLASALQVASIAVSILLIILILLQVKGGALGSLLGGDAGGGITRTRRGLEKRLFQLTIALSIAFLALSIFSVAVSA
jgi:preprotein translocase subunit SecG